MDDHQENSIHDRRAKTFPNLCLRFFIQYHHGLAFLAGWTAYPIGCALLSLVGR